MELEREETDQDSEEGDGYPVGGEESDPGAEDVELERLVARPLQQVPPDSVPA